MLDEAGYVDLDGDGWRDMPDGSAIQFEIIVPAGWTDWMESIRIIAEAFRAIGVNANPAFPDQALYEQRMQTGNFDMLTNNYGSGMRFTILLLELGSQPQHPSSTSPKETSGYDKQELFD